MSSSSESHGTHDLNVIADLQATVSRLVAAGNEDVALMKEMGAVIQRAQDRANVAEAQLKAMKEALEQLVRCEYESEEPGLCDCVDNDLVRYQSQHLANAIAAAEAALITKEATS